MVLSATARLRATPINRVIISKRAMESLLKRNPAAAQVQRIFQEAKHEASNGGDLKLLTDALSPFSLIADIVHDRVAILSPKDLAEETEIKPARRKGGSSPNRVKEVKRGNIFSLGYEIIEAETAGQSGLSIFLENDQGGKAFKKIWKHVDRNIAFGRHDKPQHIYGLNGIDTLYAFIIQERLPNGQLVKKLYGWSAEKNWGDLDHAEIIYTLARKGTGGWKILKRPSTTTSLNRTQETQRATRRMISFLLKDQGKKTHQRTWRVLHHGEVTGSITFAHKGKDYPIYGLMGYEKIETVITEEVDPVSGKKEKIACLFAYDEELKLIPTPIGIYRFAYKENGRWILDHPPTPIKSVSQAQINKALAKTLKIFLLNDQPEYAALFTINRRVYSQGSIRFNSSGEIFEISGLKEYAGQLIFCIILQKEDKKIVYLWPNETLFRSGEKPIRPAGDVIALKKDTKWKISKKKNAALVAKRRENSQYAKFLLSDNPEALHFSTWSIHRRKNRGHQAIHKSINGQKASFYCPAEAIAGLSKVLGVTRQLGSGFKLVEFYRDRQAFEAGAKPIRAALLTYKRNRLWNNLIVDITANSPFPVRELPHKALVNLAKDRYLQKNHPDFYNRLRPSIENHLRERYTAETVAHFLSDDTSENS
jgi:hypothetical protein